jgi:hypothetical protein
MTLRIPFTFAVTLAMASAALQQSALAQRNYRYAQGANPQAMYTEELPRGQHSPQPATSASPPEASYTPSPTPANDCYNEYHPSSPTHMNCVDGCCDQGCGDACGWDGGCCGDSCGSGCCSNCGRKGQCYVFADYLYVRPTFSEATAFVDQNLVTGTDRFVPLDFDYESSFRVGGGYRLCGCGNECRFTYTRLTGDASAIGLPGDIVPFNPTVPAGTHVNIDADVDINAYDIECAKTIPLGGQCGGCGCGDACGSQCGCGDACGSNCPAWDITWSGGVRIGDVNWQRSYVTVLDTAGIPLRDVNTEMDFTGAGLRAGVEGRRYFFCDGWLSVYGRGNIALLVGDVDISTANTDDQDVTVRQFYSNRQLIPVTDLEAGVTAQVTCRTAFTAGYLLSAWHDLGFRNSFDVCDCADTGSTATTPLMGTSFDDANILGFDGFFARIEMAF